MKTTIAAVAIAILVSVSGWFGYDAYSTKQRVDALHPHVKLVSLHLISILDVEGRSSNMTMGEFYAKMAASVAELDKSLLQVRNLATQNNKTTSDGVLHYIENGQSIIRDISKYYSSYTQLKSLYKVADLAIEEAKQTDSLGRYARESTDKYVAKLDEAIIEEKDALKAIVKAMPTKVLYLKAQSAWAGKIFGEDVVVPDEVWDYLAKRFR